jgi:ammonium transporter, Amt family
MKFAYNFRQIKNERIMKRFLQALPAVMLATPVFAADAPKIDAADTGFMIIATALVLMMTLPALALW